MIRKIKNISEIIYIYALGCDEMQREYSQANKNQYFNNTF